MQQIKEEKSSGIHFLIWSGFILYLLLLIKLIIFKHPLENTLLWKMGWSPEAVITHMHTGNFTPFHTIRLYLRHWSWLGHISFVNLIYNVIAFIPYGIIVPVLGKTGHSFLFSLTTGIFLSSVIEVTQLVGLLGEFDVDDIILNGTGVLVGLIIHRLFKRNKDLYD